MYIISPIGQLSNKPINLINMQRENIQAVFEALQDHICLGLEALDGSGKKFQEDQWKYSQEGGGKTRIFQGTTIEKGGVNFSALKGPLPALLQEKLGLDKGTFFATGISIVLHPRSVMCPIIHANIRYFETEKGIFWFGGGIDLTPHYVDLQLAKQFHQQLKAVCDAHHPNYYPAFKQQADDYFYLDHRQETRGIGGIFFDYLGYDAPITAQLSKTAIFEFVRAIGEAFVPLYSTQIEATRHLPYSEEDVAWQGIRRGRYVEFNLIHDKGTKFGLQTGGRTESILMSLPPAANWSYQYDFSHNPRAIHTQQYLKKGIDFLNC